MTYDNWKTTNPADEFLGPELEDDMPDTHAETVAWQPIKTAPKDEAFRLYGLNCKSAQHEWFEVHYVALVNGALVHSSGDPFSDWDYDDFEFWAPAPRFLK